MSQKFVNSQNDKVVIVGPGLLGCSIGLGLKRRGYGGLVVGVGRSEVALDRAVELGCIDRGSTDLASELTGKCLVILATPLLTFEVLFEIIAGEDD